MYLAYSWYIPYPNFPGPGIVPGQCAAAPVTDSERQRRPYSAGFAAYSAGFAVAASMHAQAAVHPSATCTCTRPGRRRHGACARTA